MARRDRRWWSLLRLRLRSLFRRDRVERDLDDELRDHLESEIAHQTARGVEPAAARTAVLRSLGTLEGVKERVRDTRRVSIIEDAVRDLRYGARLLRRQPSFTAVAVASLALGIGANTAIFQLLDAVRLRRLPVTRPDELSVVRITNRGFPPSDYNSRYPDLTYPQWERLRGDRSAFTGMLAWANQTFDLASRGESRFAENGIWVSGEFFELLGVRPAAGRLFVAGDDRPGCAAPGVVVSHAFWQREMGERPGAVGETLAIQGKALPVIGVSAPGFYGVEVGRSFDIALPLCAHPFIYGGDRMTRLDNWWLGVLGRRAPGVSLSQASAALAAISPPIFKDTVPPGYGAEEVTSYLGFTLAAADGSGGFSQVRETYATPLWLLFGVAGLVLIMACVNLASLLLARVAVRGREMAMRLAIGASRSRLIRQLLVESLLLSALGAAAGAALAPISSRLIVAMMGTDVSPLFLDLGVNWQLVTFAASLALATCLLFGLMPAWRASRVVPGDAMKQGSWTITASRQHTVLRRGLIAGQLALSFVLLAGGLLFGRSFVNLLTLDAGFQSEGILEVDVDLGRLGLAPEGRRVVRQDLLDRLRSLPAVEAVATVNAVPLVGSSYNWVFVDGPTGPARHISRFNRVSDRFFDTIGTPLIAGRDFDARDTPSSPIALIVNEAFVQRCFAGTNPIGVTIRLQGQKQQPGTPVTIVGVVGNTKHGSLRETFDAIAYLAISQSAQLGTGHNFLIRTSRPIAEIRPSVGGAVEAVNAGAFYHFHDFHQQVRYSIRLDRLMATLCGFFALLGAVLASIGVYGVTAYAVNQRTTEIGVRLAMGATPANIRRLVLRDAAIVLAVGLAAGVAITTVASSAADGLIFGLAPRDPITLALAVAGLGGVALLSTLMPAWRASRLEPTLALRRD